jgi:cephalosporin-C deacetylase-like acetyl esterase
MGREAIFILSAVAIISGSILTNFFTYKDVEVEEVEFLGKDGVLLKGVIFTPKERKEFPAILLCHGLSGKKETMYQIAVELTRNGYASFVYDFRVTEALKGE